MTRPHAVDGGRSTIFSTPRPPSASRIVRNLGRTAFRRTVNAADERDLAFFHVGNAGRLRWRWHSRSARDAPLLDQDPGVLARALGVVPVVQRDQLDGAPVDAARFVELLEERLESLADVVTELLVAAENGDDWPIRMRVWLRPARTRCPPKADRRTSKLPRLVRGQRHLSSSSL